MNSSDATGSPKGNRMLFPAYNDKRKKRVRKIARLLCVAYNVIMTPQRFVDKDSDPDDQRWSVMPDVPSTHAEFKPESKFPTKSEAIDRANKLDKEEGTYGGKRPKVARSEWLSPHDAASAAWQHRVYYKKRQEFTTR